MFFPQELPAGESAAIKAFLTTALSRKIKGDPGNYNVIVEQLEKRNDEEMLWKVLVGLCSCASLLTSRADKYSQLIGAIFAYNWTSTQRVNTSYLNLIGYLVSSNATFLIPSFEFLVKSFSDASAATSLSASTAAAAAAAAAASSQGAEGIDKQGLNDDNISVSSLRTRAANNVEMEQRFQDIHHTVHGLTQLAPTGLSELFPMLSRFFPHKRFSADRLCAYVQHLLRVCEYLPVLQPKVLDLIMLKCLEIDVEIVIEDTGEVKIQEDHGGDNGDEMFLLDEEPEGGRRPGKYLNASSAANNRALQAEQTTQRIPPEVAELADKLDALLSLLVGFIERSKDDAFERLFQQLLCTFEERVLVTHRSKFVQFAIFLAASRSERFACALAGRLLRCFLDHGSSALKQQSAVLYLGSFLSRATFLPLSVVSGSLAELLAWCNSYVSSACADSPVSAVLAARLAATSSSSFSSSSSASPPSGGEGRLGALLNKPVASSSGSTGSTTSSASSHSDTTDPAPMPPASPRFTPPRRRPDLGSHETFYYCMQAVLYAYCFHGTDLTSPASGSSSQSRARLVAQTQLERCIASSLDPLRFCLATVRVEFLRLALQTGLLSQACVGSVSPDLLPGASETGGGGGPGPVRVPIILSLGQAGRRPAPRSLTEGANPLDTFFPFDPCLLRRMHHSIEASYRVWMGVPGLDQGTSGVSGHEDEEEDEEEEEEDEGMDARSMASLSISASESAPGSQASTTSHMDHFMSASLASSHHPFEGLGGGHVAMDADDDEQHHQQHHVPFTASNIFLAQQVGGGAPTNTLPLRRPRQYSVTSTGSF